MKHVRFFVASAILLFLLQVPSAHAVTIVTGFLGGNAPAHAVGGGNLDEIVRAATQVWARAYDDSFTIRLYYGWAPLAEAGTHVLIEQGQAPNRELVGAIFFSNSDSVTFFMDPTPDQHEEFGRRTMEYQDLGGGFINVARLLSNPVGDAAVHTDLLTVALHEIGHAMGMGNDNASFRRESGSAGLTLAGGLPFEGTVIPLATNYSGLTSHFDSTRVAYGALMAGVAGGERRLPSALDILANAQISGFQSPRID